MHISYIASTFLPSVAQAALISYNWDVAWLQANPDGRQARPVIGINGQW
jgi:iron transport multicopper oxidase